MATAKQLYELQDIDLNIERKNQSIEQIKSQLGKDEQLVAARGDIETAHKRLLDLEHQQRQEDSQVAELTGKISVEEKKLYGGTVMNTKELISMQQDVNQIKARRKEHEERLLGIMLEVDAAQQEIAQKQDALKKLESEWQAEQQRLQSDQAAIETELETARKDRDTAATRIDPPSLKTYQQLRKEKQGRAVARIEQGKCGGCRIGLSMADMQRARSAQNLARCSNCDRILYLGS